jgi:hypothetical protein
MRLTEEDQGDKGNDGDINWRCNRPFSLIHDEGKEGICSTTSDTSEDFILKINLCMCRNFNCRFIKQIEKSTQSHIHALFIVNIITL